METVFGIISAIAAIGFQAYGIYKQQNANEKAWDIEQARYEDESEKEDEDFAVSKAIQNRQMRLKEKTQKFVEEQTEKKWEWEEEKKDFDRGTMFTNRFVGMLSQEPMMRSQLMNVWGKK